jgi:hypothetical protein
MRRDHHSSSSLLTTHPPRCHQRGIHARYASSSLRKLPFPTKKTSPSH